MELRLLRYFVAVAEELHFARAADRLFIAQPSLSQQIRKLEKDIGVELFARDRRGVALTAAGQALLEPARSLLHDADGLGAVARAAAGQPRGRLVLGYVDYARAQIVPGLLDGFRRHAPEGVAEVRACGTSPEVLGLLRSGQIDAGILRTPLPVAAPWARSTVLTVEPMVAALPRGHSLTQHPEVRLAALAAEPFALFARDLNPPAHDHLMAFFALAGRRPNVVQENRRMDESLLFVASGRGVAMFPAPVAAAMNEPGIVFRDLVDPTPTVDIVLIWDPHTLNPLVPVLVATAETARGDAGR